MESPEYKKVSFTEELDGDFQSISSGTLIASNVGDAVDNLKNEDLSEKKLEMNNDSTCAESNEMAELEEITIGECSLKEEKRDITFPRLRVSIYSNETGNSETSCRLDRLGRRSSRYSIASSSSSIEKDAKSNSFWSRFIDKEHIWKNQDINFDNEDDFTRCQIFREWVFTSAHSIKNIVFTAIYNPLILVTTLLIFIVLCSVGLVIIQAFVTVHYNNRVDTASDVALKSGAAFSKALEDAGRGPLFAISQFVKQLESFQQIPASIGQRNDTGSAPPLQGKEKTHRDLTNTGCMDQSIINRFDEIAKGVKKDAGLEKILVSLQLAPVGVVCMIYPLINSEDFAYPLYMNNTGALGHDLLFDERRTDGARKALSSEDPVSVGPLSLIQGDHKLVKEAFIMRFAINMTGVFINVPQESGPDIVHESWGFAVVLLNWDMAKKKTGLMEEFEKSGLDFLLFRMDTKVDGETGKVLGEEMKNIASSPNWELLNERNSVRVNLTSTSELWTMQVGDLNGFQPSWKVGLQVLVVFLALILSVMSMVVLVVRKQLQILLYNMMPPQIISRLRKGETIVQMYENATIYFSDIVEFTKLSGTMSPLEVMEMLNEIYTEFDQLVRKHGVYKVETIGDAYIVIGGGPDRCTPVEGATRVTLFALDAIEFVKNYRTKNQAQVHIRAGLASGAVVGGVVGTSMPKFTLFGDTVNLASRMESTSKAMMLQCTTLTHNLLREAHDTVFKFDERIHDNEHGIHIKGKGMTKTWWILGSKLRD